MKKHDTLSQFELAEILERAILTQADIDNFERLHQMPLEHTVNTQHLNASELSQIHNLLPSLFAENRRIKQVMQYKQSAKQNVCIIDYFNCTFKQQSISVPFTQTTNVEYEYEHDFYHASSPQYTEFIHTLSKQLEKIFGYGITTVRPTGINFYDRSFELGDGYGFIGHGGQNDTILITINGTGCAQASEGWQLRLYQFLLLAVQPSITRVDLAHDDFNGTVFNCQSVLDLYEAGKFTCYRKAPQISYVGDWFSSNDTKGRTIYIGSRGSDKYLRCYEKGKQLESQDKPNWFRCEVEFHNRDTIIDLEVLINPHVYFAGAYPAFEHLANQFDRFETIQHEVKADVTHRVFHAKRQAGSVINLLVELGYTQEQIMAVLLKDSLPKKFVQKFLENPHQSIHENSAQIPMNPTISA
jgi:phage replication initiation protein